MLIYILAEYEDDEIIKAMTKAFYETNPEIKAAIDALQEKFSGNGRVLIRPSGTEPLVE